jgi:hypothetical protein
LPPVVLAQEGYAEEDVPEIIRLFFWFGILGAKNVNGEEKYVYDFRYDEKIFARVRQIGLGKQEPVFVNTAFARGLDCRDLR